MTSEKIFWQVFPLSLVPSYFVRGGKEKFLFLFPYSRIYLFIYLFMYFNSVFVYLHCNSGGERENIDAPIRAREKPLRQKRALSIRISFASFKSAVAYKVPRVFSVYPMLNQKLYRPSINLEFFVSYKFSFPSVPRFRCA